jgi:hypothetical protein
MKGRWWRRLFARLCWWLSASRLSSDNNLNHGFLFQPSIPHAMMIIVDVEWRGRVPVRFKVAEANRAVGG